jgi:hypothetical protein
VTYRWKALNKSYNFGLDLIPIRVWGEKLWVSKVSGLQFGIVSGAQLGSPGKKSHSDVAFTVRCREYYMGEDGASPESGPWWVLCVKVPMACPNTQGCSRMLINLLVVRFGCRFKLDNLVFLPSLIPGLLARPLLSFSAGSQERPLSPNFPQLYIVGPSSGFNKGLGSVSIINKLIAKIGLVLAKV